MTKRATRAGSARVRARLAGVLPVVLALLVVGTACGSGTKSEAAQAQDALARGLKAHRAGNVVEATKDYHEVLAHDPNNKFAYYNLGLIDQLASRAIEAEANYRSALKIDPDFTAALFNLAILRTNPAPQEALALYRHVLAVKADDAAAHLNLGFLLLSLGQPIEGNAELDRAIALDPSLASRRPPQTPVGVTTSSTPSSTSTTRR